MLILNKTTHDFGNVTVGSTVSISFLVTNTFNGSIELTHGGACGCTTTEFIINGVNSTKLLAGETGEFKINFSPKSYGSNNKTGWIKPINGEQITVYFNANGI